MFNSCSEIFLAQLRSNHRLSWEGMSQIAAAPSPTVQAAHPAWPMAAVTLLVPYNYKGLQTGELGPLYQWDLEKIIHFLGFIIHFIFMASLLEPERRATISRRDLWSPAQWLELIRYVIGGTVLYLSLTAVFPFTTEIKLSLCKHHFPLLEVPYHYALNEPKMVILKWEHH